MTDRAGLTDAECDALIRADLDKYRPNRDRNLDPLIRLEYRGWVRAAYAAGQAAASVPEPTTGFHLTMSEGLSRFTHHGPLTTSKFDDVFTLLYAAPAVAQEKRNE